MRYDSENKEVYGPSCQYWRERRVLQNMSQNAGQEFKFGRQEKEVQDVKIGLSSMQGGGVCNLLEIWLR